MERILISATVDKQWIYDSASDHWATTYLRHGVDVFHN